MPKRASWKQLDLSGREHFDEVALYTFDEDEYKDEGLIAELPPRWANSRMASLERMMNDASLSSDLWVRKLVFPSSLGETIWTFLYDRNVHPLTLFPDLDGLAQLLKLKNHVFWSHPKPVL